MNGNDRVAHFIRDLTWEALPADVQHKAKICVLDALGATLVGTRTPISRLTAAYAAEAWKGDEATVLVHGQRATAAGAALANGYAANGLDIDDIARYTKGHPGAQVLPSALAVAEKLNRSGRELLTAVVVGFEVAHRTARCWHDHHNIYQACGSWGSVTNAAIAAHLMGLDLGQIHHALGIAEYHAPNLPMMRDIDYPTMVKHGIGWGTMTGITAAELAARGFTGIPSLLGFEKYRDWVADIGDHYIMIDGVAFKEHCCCYWAHPAVNAVRDLKRRHSFDVEDVARVRVAGFYETVCLGTKLPATTEEAQFNTAWPVAAMLVDGEVGPAQMLDERLGDERIAAVANKIELVESEEISELSRLKEVGDPRGEYASDVEITLTDGRRLSSGVVSIRDDEGRRWTQERVESKFRWLLDDFLPASTVEALVAMVRDFDRLDHVGALIELVPRERMPAA